MKVIVPCAGRSSRYPGMPPKWSLAAADGRPMLAHAVTCLEADPRDVIVTILREHDAQLDGRTAIKKALGARVEIVVLDQRTESAPETIARTLQSFDLDEPFLVKDCDNQFRLSPLARAFDYVATASLDDWPSVKAHNKSYVDTDATGTIRMIREKDMISRRFCTGGYYFRQPRAFLEAFAALSAGQILARELYVSDVVARMMANGIAFRAVAVTDYEDWGTIDEWRATLSKRKISEAHG